MRFRLLIIAAAISLGHAERHANACSGVYVGNLAEFPVQPRSGTVAVRNTAIWIPIPNANGTAEPTVVVRQGGTVVGATTRPINVGSNDVLWLVQPVTPFAVGSLIEVLLDGAVITDFTIGSDEASAPPDAPTASAIEVDAGSFGLLFCGEDSAISVETTATDFDLLMLADRGTTGIPSDIVGISATKVVRAISADSGRYALQLVALDLAGNVSAPTNLPEITVPEAETGCTTTGGGGCGTAWLAVAAVGLMIRRRRQPTFVCCETKNDVGQQTFW